MKTIYFLIIVFVFFGLSEPAMAQIVDSKDLIPPVRITAWNKTDSITKKVFVFSIFVSINSEGKVDSVFFSKIREPWHLKSVVDQESIIHFYKVKNNMKFQQYKGCIMVTPVMLRSGDDIHAIYLPQLITDFENLFDVGDNFRKRRIIVNKPIALSYAFLY